MNSTLPSMAPIEEPLPAMPPLTICLIGGIYGKSSSYRQKVPNTPETLLEKALRRRGQEVLTLGQHTQHELAQADVIHVHHLGPAAARLAATPGRAAFVFTSHDGPSLNARRQGVAARAAARFVFSRSDAVVALSRREREFQQRTYLLGGIPHLVIANGADSETFTFSRRNRAGHGVPWKLLCAGQLIAGKGIDLLLRALAQVSCNVVLELVYHTSALEPRLRQLVRDLGIEERVRFLGCQSPAALGQTYAAADVLVLPSLAESLPTVVSEAMLCGTPVLATDTGGVREQLAGYGLLVAPGNVAEIRGGIERMVNEYPRFAAQGPEMSRYAGQRFSVAAMAEKHLQLYRALTREKQPRRRNHPSAQSLNLAVRTALSILCRK